MGIAGTATVSPYATTVPALHEVLIALDATLADKGLDRMTAKRIELVLCGPALTAHI